MPRPSGMRHSPQRARSSGRAPFTRRPAIMTSPLVAPSGARRRPCSVVDLPAPFGPSSATTLTSGHDEVDPVQHVDAVVAGAEAAQLEQRLGLDLGGVGTALTTAACLLVPRYASSTACRAGSRRAVRRWRSSARSRGRRPGRTPPSPATCRARPARPPTPSSASSTSSWPKRSVSWSSWPDAGSSSSSTFGLQASARPSSTSRPCPVGSEVTRDVGDVGEADPLDDRLGERGRVVAVLGPAAPDVGRHPDVLPDGQHGEQLEALEGAGQSLAGPLVQADPGDVLVRRSGRGRRSAAAAR